MLRDLLPEDKEIYLSMSEDFYSSPAVAGNVPRNHFENTFDELMKKSPFMRALIIEEDKAPAGYALLSFTYSNEFGGMLVLIEELYIAEAYRSKGLGSNFFEFLEREYASAKQFRMEVRKDNGRVIDLYGRLGFKVHDYLQMVKDIRKPV